MAAEGEGFGQNARAHAPIRIVNASWSLLLRSTRSASKCLRKKTKNHTIYNFTTLLSVCLSFTSPRAATRVHDLVKDAHACACTHP